MKTNIQNVLLVALALSSVAPMQAQSIRHAASRMGSSVAGGARHTTDWVHRQIESVALPRRARQRIVSTLRLSAQPTEKDFAVLKKYIQGKSLNRSERRTWRKYRNRALSTRGAVATITAVVVAILATMGAGAYWATKGEDQGEPLVVGGPEGFERKGGAGVPTDRNDSQGNEVQWESIVFFESSKHGKRNWKVDTITDNYLNLVAVDDDMVRQPKVDPRLVTIVTGAKRTHPEVGGAAAASGAVEVAGLQALADDPVVQAQAAAQALQGELVAARRALTDAEQAEQVARMALETFNRENPSIRGYGDDGVPKHLQPIVDQRVKLHGVHLAAQEQVRQTRLAEQAVRQQNEAALRAVRQAREAAYRASQ
jgi:hypothetical protein